MAHILIVDDEQSIQASIAGILQDEGYQTSCASDGEAALRLIQEEAPELILLDIWMPGMDGINVLKKIQGLGEGMQVIMMSGHATIETAVTATKLGAHDFIEKPISIEKLLLCIQNALKLNQLVEENKNLRARISRDYEIIGSSQAIKELKQQIRIAAPTSGWVLITGENGTGKELVARAIHRQSKRAKKAFIEVNCAAIPEDLIESELFGHEKGAFTGATSMRKGKFDLAHEGTLFLDEIGDMSLKTQAKVLRILQEHKFERVGGERPIEIEVRVIAATNKNLEEEIKQGNFREDLYYRLNVLPFQVPALRDRSDDIPILAQHFLKSYCQKESAEGKQLTDDMLKALSAYKWPGNVRELKNIIERLAIMTQEDVIDVTALPAEIRNATPSESGIEPDPLLTGEYSDLKEAREHFEKEFIRSKLIENNWNVSKTAEEIGLERSNLHRKIKSFGIEADKS
ncbi:MAG: sigma-54 dependent transcriptional regulator [Desulfuromonadaceae bacterium]|nr:sigma-54 dependent transcriptional regulator [Desulfuromonas sp.]MDY0185898.1 sigma-54 dependent transcriptional regulator [Desulfuromonadaceae bacterium]